MSDWIYFSKDPVHIHKEREKARKLRKSQWWKTKISQGICYYCHLNIDPHLLTMDHIVPLARNGKSNKGNVVVCCQDCNQKKKIFTPVEMLLNKKAPT